jgi:glutathione S-transferase
MLLRFDRYRVTGIAHMPDCILHHYWQSPFAHKIRLACRLAKMSWVSVEIPRLPPKPDLMPLTGGYRRTPVMQIGADIFCDTQNIVRALGEAGHHTTLFADHDSARILTFVDWLDAVVFDLAVRVVLTNALDSASPEFLDDRGSLYFEPDWSAERLQFELPSVVRQLHAHCVQINASLAHRVGMFSNQLSYADVGVAFLAWFLRGRWDRGAEFLDQFPHVLRIEAALDALPDQYVEMSASDALKEAARCQPEWGGTWISSGLESLSQGDAVRVKPTGQSADPWVSGRLQNLTETRISVARAHPDVGEVAVHFPVAGYHVLAEDAFDVTTPS